MPNEHDVISLQIISQECSCVGLETSTSFILYSICIQGLQMSNSYASDITLHEVPLACQWFHPRFNLGPALQAQRAQVRRRFAVYLGDCSFFMAWMKDFTFEGWCCDVSDSVLVVAADKMGTRTIIFARQKDRHFLIECMHQTTATWRCWSLNTRPSDV